jgi:type IV pilus assembly protein PilM
MADFFSSIKNIFKRGGDSVLGVDVGSSSIKIVQLRKSNGRAILETYGELSLGPLSTPALEIGRATNLQPDKLSQALSDLMRESNVTTHLCGISIPIQSSLVAVIEMPSLDNKELSQMVPIEARKYIPVPISEVALDWWIIPKDESSLKREGATFSNVNQINRISEKTDVLIVAIHNDALVKYQGIMSGAGLSSSFYEIEMFATMRAVLDQANTTQMVCDIGAGYTKLYVVEHGIIRNSHIINRGSQDITLALARSFGIPAQEAELLKRNYGLSQKYDKRDIPAVVQPVLNFIVAEANRVIMSYQHKYNKSIARVVLTGGGANLKGLHDYVKGSFQTDVVMADPFARVDSPAFLEGTLRAAGPEFAVAIGVALRRLQELN